MNDHWADVFVRSLLISGYAILILVGILMLIDSYITEKSGKPSSHFKTAAKVVLILWFINNFAMFIFGILAEWFSLVKWEIWAAYAVAFLIGLVIWLISRQESSKEGKNLVLFALLSAALIIISIIAGVGLFRVQSS